MILLTAQETAGLLRISLSSLARLQRDRKLRVVKIGTKRLFDRGDVERFVEQSKTPVRRIPKF